MIGDMNIRQLASGLPWSIGGGSCHSTGGKCESESEDRCSEGSGVDVTDIWPEGLMRTRSYDFYQCQKTAQTKNSVGNTFRGWEFWAPLYKFAR